MTPFFCVGKEDCDHLNVKCSHLGDCGVHQRHGSYSETSLENLELSALKAAARNSHDCTYYQFWGLVAREGSKSTHRGSQELLSDEL